MTITMPPNPSCSRGDVVLVLFPHSDLQTAKTRPALFMQADDLNTGVAQVIVAMISGRMFRAGHPSRVVIAMESPAGRQSGLLGDSVVMADNVATVTVAAVDRALRHTFAI